MNSERRHELQQNDLAIYLSKINKSIEPYSTLIAVTVGLLFVAAIGYGFYRSERSGTQSEATLELIQTSPSQDAEEFMTVSERFPGTVASDWARLYQGQTYLSQGIQALYVDREQAVELLEDSQTVFRDAISRTKDPLLKSRGQYGIARASESLGNLDEAIEEYKKLMEVSESEAMDEKAQERIDALSRPDTKAFVSWFAKEKFTRTDPSMPPTLPGGDALPSTGPSMPPLNLNFGGERAAADRDLEGGIELPEEGSEMKTDSDAESDTSPIVFPEGTDTDAPAADAADATEDPAADPAAETAPANSDAPAADTSEEAAEVSEEDADTSADDAGSEEESTASEEEDAGEDTDESSDEDAPSSDDQ